MQTNYERYCKMSSLAQIGWWEADFLAGHYVCSDFLCDLLGLEGDTISFMDFQNLIREDYREQIVQEFRANANIHKDFYEQTFPICLKNGEVWLHTRLALREKGTGTNGGDKSFGVIQRVEAPKEVEQKNTLRRVNDLLRRQNYISQSLLRFLHDDDVDSCIMEILNDVLSLYQGGRVYIFEYNEDYTHHSCTYEVVSEGVSKEKNKQQSIPVNETRWWCEQILSGKPIILTSLKQLPEEAENEYKFLDAQGICSLMVAPLMAGDRVWGFMGIDLVESYREWSNEDFQWFSSLANIISICIELRKAKDRVVREQSFLSNLFHFMPLGYIRMSVVRDENGQLLDYKITDVNKACSRFFARPAETYIGVLASEIYPDFSSQLLFLKEVLDNNSYREKDIFFPQTELYTHWIVYSPEKDEVVGLFTDSTEAVKTNRALDRSEKLFKSIFANIPAGVEIYDKDGFLIDLNNKDLEIFGVENKQDVIGVNFFENPNVPQHIRDRVRDEDLVDFRLNYSFERAEGYYHPDRRDTIDIYTKVSKLYDNEGNFNGYILISIDNTEQIDAMNRIRDFENFFLLISDYAKVGYAKLNLLNRKGYAIKQWYKNLGEEEDTPLADVVGVYRNMHPEDRERIFDFYREVRKGNRKHFQGEMRIYRPGKKNEWNWIRMNVVVTTYNPEENEVEIIGINYDITELKETEKELILARDKAEMMDRLKSAFLANMSHEIRTPLNAIVGFSELMVYSEDPAEKEEYMSIIQSNNELLLRLINDILDLSKIESGILERKRETFNLAKVCGELYTMIQPKITNPDVEFQMANSGPDCWIFLDRNRLKQVWMNYLTNAIKCTKSGHIKMGYGIERGGIRIYVEDSGVGIPIELQERVFGRFQKLNEFAQGTGLGLAISRAIIEGAGGEVGFTSTPDVGSTFWAWIPCEISIQEEDSPTVSQPSKQQTSLNEIDKKELKILIAEDNDSNYTLVQHILNNYNLTHVQNGVEAVNKVREEEFDLILMDMKMPVMGGLEATRKIREFNQKIPIIALTANAFDSDRVSALDAGCNEFLAKPIKKSQLLELFSKKW